MCSTIIWSIIAAIAGAAVGGSFTLLGAVVTIKHTQKEKRDDEIKKAKPFLFIFCPGSILSPTYSNIFDSLSSKNARGTLKKANKRECYKLAKILIANSDYSCASLVGFKINKNDYHLFDYGKILLKNTYYNFSCNYKFEFDSKIETLALLLLDTLGNIYEFGVKFSVNREKQNTIEIESGLEIIKSTLPINGKNI